MEGDFNDVHAFVSSGVGVGLVGGLGVGFGY